MSKFKYCNYWMTWNRCFPMFGNNFIELDLTPVNPGTASAWEKTKQEVFRSHGTIDKKDKFVEVLPELIQLRMEKFYGYDLTNRMLHHDYLSEITLEDIFNANCKSNGGGVPLQAIKDIRNGKLKFWQNR